MGNEPRQTPRGALGHQGPLGSPSLSQAPGPASCTDQSLDTGSTPPRKRPLGGWRFLGLGVSCCGL